ncbi:MAG TPA: TetR/AcrR family transcriptional regulator [Terricaulis sp.]|nr:TetR/AcrR family transcriptional regulator [Terricaulis sp.]HRP10732.1 TetR/AcrR family transcriptional regulator [Terricaulis sp.]
MDAQPSRKRSEATTLDAATWIEAAMDALAEGGIDAVRIDPLAKRLGVTRGSFYWHFKDRDALHQAMLKRWRERASYNIITRIEGQHEPVRERLKRLLALPYSSSRSARGAAIEVAVRLWARRDRNAAKAVRHIDRVRLEYFERIFAEHGFAKAKARQRAYVLYAALMAEALIVVDSKEPALIDLDKFLLD